MTRVRLPRNAERWFFKRIAEIAEVDPSAARKIVSRLERLKNLLSTFPEMTERGVLPGTRRIAMHPFILVARIRNDVVEIIAIRHARQRDARAPSELSGSDQETNNE
jgi:plasmid stabilization system protein ParE